MKKPNLLIVDDNEDLRSVFADVMRNNGFNVLIAETGEKAIEVLEKSVVDIVASDVKMPGMSGVDLLKWIKKRDKNFPVVFLVSGFSEITLEEAILLGAEGLLDKPFRTKDVLAKLQPYMQAARGNVS